MSSPEDLGGPPPPGEPSEEELRAAYEAELSRITTTDLIAQATISILNLGARKLAPDAEGPPGGTGSQDLEQVRDAIDAARALIGVLERTIPQDLPPLRDALSRLQMAYAQEVQRAPAAGAPPEPQAPPAESAGGGAQPSSTGKPADGGDQGGDDGGEAGGEAPAGGQPPPDSEQRHPGPAESSGRLWVPGK